MPVILGWASFLSERRRCIAPLEWSQSSSKGAPYFHCIKYTLSYFLGEVIFHFFCKICQKWATRLNWKSLFKDNMIGYLIEWWCRSMRSCLHKALPLRCWPDPIETSLQAALVNLGGAAFLSELKGCIAPPELTQVYPMPGRMGPYLGLMWCVVTIDAGVKFCTLIILQIFERPYQVFCAKFSLHKFSGPKRPIKRTFSVLFFRQKKIYRTENCSINALSYFSGKRNYYRKLLPKGAVFCIILDSQEE